MRLFGSITQFLAAGLMLVLPIFGQSSQMDSSTAAHVRAETQQAQQATRPKATINQSLPQAGSSVSAASASQPNQPPTMQQVPQSPDAPLRPAQMPPSPPRVSYVGGQLTVTASNATFSDVLIAVRNATGIRIEGIGLTGGDRVFGQFGPGSPRDVLDFLLTGARFDFIILGTLEDPNAAQKLILSPRMGPSQTGPQSAGMPQARPGIRPPANNEDNDVDSQQADVADEQPAAVQPPPTQPSLAQPFPVQQTGSPQPANPQQNNGVKTPEQLLEEMRRLNRGNGNAQTPPQPTQPNLQPNMPPETVPR